MAPAADRSCVRAGCASASASSCRSLLAPIAGACPRALSIAVMRAGGMGACGALLMAPGDIADWCAAVRAKSGGVRFGSIADVGFLLR